MTSTDPEIGSSINAAGITTNYHDMGDGDPVLLIHGSGPGVSAWANWRTVMPALSRQHRVVAPDIVGFGYTDRPDDFQFIRDSWTAHLVAFVDALDLPEVSIVGNSSVARSHCGSPPSVRGGYGDSSSWAAPASPSRSLRRWTRCGGTNLRWNGWRK
jgi:hypothetical protein